MGPARGQALGKKQQRCPVKWTFYAASQWLPTILIDWHLSTLIREASVGSWWRSAQRPATEWGTENTWWLAVFSTKQNIYVTPFLLRWRKHCKSQRQWGTVLNTAGQLCTDITEVVTVCTDLCLLKLAKIPARRSHSHSACQMITSIFFFMNVYVWFLFLLGLFVLFWDRISLLWPRLAWDPLCRSGSASGSQGSACLCSPNTSIKGVCHHAEQKVHFKSVAPGRSAPNDGHTFGSKQAAQIVLDLNLQKEDAKLGG